MTIKPEHALSTSIGRGTAVRISWGLVQIPTRLHILSDGERSVPARSRFTPDGHPIGNRGYDKVTLDNYGGDVVKKAQVGAEWVELTDDELDALSTTAKGVAEIVAFVPLGELSRCYVTEKVGVWAPDTMKVGKTKIVDPGAAKASALLRAAMTARSVAALVYVPSNAGGQYVALLPSGRCEYLAFAESVRVIPDTCAEVPVSEAEMALASQLIDGIGIDVPVLTDNVGAVVRNYLAAKATGEVTAPVVAEIAPPPVDILAALQASLAAKPAPAKAAKKVKVAS